MNTTYALSSEMDDYKAHYDLLWRVTNPEAQIHTPGLTKLDRLQQLLKVDLRALARRGSPDDFADIYFSIEQELERFQEFCAFPALSSRVVVAFGGAFSAGKSSLINALLGQRLLPVEVDTTTAVPTYLFRDSLEQCRALNLHGHQITLSPSEFASLKHDSENPFGQRIARLLRAAILSRPDFPWSNLAFADTPGYTKAEDTLHNARTDESIAHSQLNAAQAIVWIVSAEAGGINESDVQFLARLDNKAPCLIVVSRADKKTPQDIQNVVAGIRSTLANRNIACLDVVPVSVRDQENYPPSRILSHLDAWNESARELAFARNFKKQFMRFSRFIETEQRNARLQLNRLKRISALADSSDHELLECANELDVAAMHELRMFEQLSLDLAGLRQKFFIELKAAGDAVGIPIPEPAEIDLIQISCSNLLPALIDERNGRGAPEPDHRTALSPLMCAAEVGNLANLIRRVKSQTAESLAPLQTDAEVTNLAGLLRQQNPDLHAALINLS